MKKRKVAYICGYIGGKYEYIYADEKERIHEIEERERLAEEEYNKMLAEYYG